MLVSIGFFSESLRDRNLQNKESKTIPSDNCSAPFPLHLLLPKEGALIPIQLRACSPKGDPVTPWPKFKVQYSEWVVSYPTISMKATPQDGPCLLATGLLSPCSVPDQRAVWLADSRLFCRPAWKRAPGRGDGEEYEPKASFIPDLDLGFFQLFIKWCFIFHPAFHSVQPSWSQTPQDQRGKGQSLQTWTLTPNICCLYILGYQVPRSEWMNEILLPL